MKSRIIKYCSPPFLAIIFAFTNGGCSGNVARNSNLNLKIKLQNENAWLNLMPGDNSTFHFTGKLSIINTGTDSIKKIQLTELDIYSGSTLVYKLTPVFINPDSAGDFTLPPLIEKQFSFGLPLGIKIKKEISSGLNVNARFVFDSGGVKYIFEAKNLKIEKLY